jgi:putative flippase GtrA
MRTRGGANPLTCAPRGCRRALTLRRDSDDSQVDITYASQPHPMNLRESLFAKLLRYASVSVATTALSLSVLSVLVAVVHVEAVRANIIATICGIGPSYYLNRRWVWKHPESRFARHVVPFWAMSLSGLLLSSISVHVADRLAQRLPADIRTLAILAANVTAFGTLWIIQFVINDRVLFKKTTSPEQVGPGLVAPPSSVQLDQTDDVAVRVAELADRRAAGDVTPREPDVAAEVLHTREAVVDVVDGHVERH